MKRRRGTWDQFNKCEKLSARAQMLDTIAETMPELGHVLRSHYDLPVVALTAAEEWLLSQPLLRAEAARWVATYVMRRGSVVPVAGRETCRGAGAGWTAGRAAKIAAKAKARQKWSDEEFLALFSGKLWSFKKMAAKAWRVLGMSEARFTRYRVRLLGTLPPERVKKPKAPRRIRGAVVRREVLGLFPAWGAEGMVLRAVVARQRPRMGLSYDKLDRVGSTLRAEGWLERDDEGRWRRTEAAEARVIWTPRNEPMDEVEL